MFKRRHMSTEHFREMLIHSHGSIFVLAANPLVGPHLSSITLPSARSGLFADDVGNVVNDIAETIHIVTAPLMSSITRL